jgi:selenocysteine lyase/cysteine desulfurase
VRLSPGIFTTPEEVDNVVEAIRQIAAHCTFA